YHNGEYDACWHENFASLSESENDDTDEEGQRGVRNLPHKMGHEQPSLLLDNTEEEKKGGEQAQNTHCHVHCEQNDAESVEIVQKIEMIPVL
ncbi:hypothetical protein PFISCL1PPCAC_524, partial [Pristionchus fissidentatus]